MRWLMSLSPLASTAAAMAFRPMGFLALARVPRTWRMGLTSPAGFGAGFAAFGFFFAFEVLGVAVAVMIAPFVCIARPFRAGREETSATAVAEQLDLEEKIIVHLFCV